MTPRQRLAILRSCSGPLYDELRDLALEDDDLAELVALDRDHAAWRRSSLAAILDGWRAQGPGYRDLIDEIAGLDVDPQLQRAAGLSSWYTRYFRRGQELGADFVPLYAERLWKHHDTMPGWQQRLWLYLVKGSAAAGLTDLLLDYAVQPGASASLALDVILELPQVDGLAARLDQLFERHQHLAGDLQRARRRLP